jgi:MFS family permease
MTTGREFHNIVWPMAVGETIVWAAFYYLFPALLPEWERTMGWTKTELSGAMTLALLTSALLAPFAGRLIDHGSGRYMFTGGTVFGGVMLVALSQVTQLWQFYVVWFGLGVAMSATLYVPCFAVLTHYMADRAKRAIMLVTLVAGLAGTIAFPGAHALIEAMDWRSAVLVFAGFVFLVSVPTIWISCKRAEATGGHSVPETSAKTRDVMVVTKTVTFWLLCIVVMAMALGHGMIITHLLPILDDRGVHPEAAILAASLIGPMQVSGRLAMMAAERHVSMMVIGVGSFAALFLGALALLSAGGSPALVVGFVILQGAGAGVTSIVRPVITAELLGRRNFGVISGMLAIPYMGGFALAPSVAALLWTVGGYDLALMLAAGLAVMGMLAVLGASHWRPALPANPSSS